ncbi:MAG: hypothetical protein ABI846_06900 [Rudaea sp.]
MSNPEQEQRRGARAAADVAGMRFTQIGSLSALIFSILALVTSVFQTRLMQSQTELMQKQSRASVWPSISVGENSTDRHGEEAFSWRIDNNGVGPAKIESAVVSLDGKPYATWKKLFAVLIPDKVFHASQSSVNGVVLPPSLNRDTMIEMVKVTEPELARAVLDGKSRFQIQVCYCSVYDECWIAKLSERSPQPVPRCESAGAAEFEE